MASSKTLIKKSKSLASAKLAVAFSGGLDSAVLLHATVMAHGAQNVYAFHVHHGIQKQATKWQKYCRQVAAKLGCHFDTRNIQLSHSSNIEAQAREHRYQALREMCQVHQIENLLVAHHQDDQAETVLIQLMRGSGLAGLSAMPPLKQTKSSQIYIWRPFLELRKEELEAYAKENQLAWIEDPSNQDEAYRRNAIRKTLLPQLEEVQPGAIRNLARSARHMAEAQELLNHLADIDLGLIESAKGLSKTNLLRLYKTNQPRAKNALRRWLSRQDLAYPSEERLTAWFVDLQQVRKDAQLQWEHDGVLIRLWREHLLVEKVREPKQSKRTELNHPSGEWVFKKLPAKSKKAGIATDRFNEARAKGLINTMERQGGEKFKVHINRPRKSLKNLYQEASIPPWQRDVPLFYIGDELVAVAGIGISADWQSLEGPRFGLEWLFS